MQWLTEMSLGYLGALEEEDNDNHGYPPGGNNTSSMKTRLRFSGVADEIRMLLRILFELLDDGIQEYGAHSSRKVLPQVLGLVPILFGVLADLTNASDAEKSDHELREVCSGSLSTRNPCRPALTTCVFRYWQNLVKLLELPWNPRTIPFLLDLLKESASIMSPSGWNQLQVCAYLTRTISTARALITLIGERRKLTHIAAYLGLLF